MTKRRANYLDGKSWTRHSISLWSDIQKSKEERALKHPALFPVQLADRLIQCFLHGLITAQHALEGVVDRSVHVAPTGVRHARLRRL